MKRTALAVFHETYTGGTVTYVLWGDPRNPEAHKVKEYAGEWSLAHFARQDAKQQPG